LREVDALPDGAASAVMTATRPSVALLASSFDPRWTARLDGRPVPTQMVAPSLVGVPLTPGRHTVVFVYRPYPRYWALLLIGAVALAGLITVPEVRRRRAAAR